jgi:sugar fermentation stimulation protein A
MRRDWPGRGTDSFPGCILRPMRFPLPLVSGVLLRREKRFLTYVRLDDGREVIAHTNNTGAMTGCSEPGSRVWLSPAADPKRKLKWTWEIVEVAPDVLLGVNTILPNKIVREAIEADRIPALRGYDRIRPEQRAVAKGSRFDLLLERGDADNPERCWVEIKSVTLVDGTRAYFPDSPSVRGRKHLVELRECVDRGERAVIFFVLQRSDALTVSPADAKDPAYGQELRRAVGGGVEAMAWRASVSPEAIEISEELPVVIP